MHPVLKHSVLGCSAMLTICPVAVSDAVPNSQKGHLFMLDCVFDIESQCADWQDHSREQDT